jgi:FHS family glucose/mannose:H+ symporter-like MFS transporter
VLLLLATAIACYVATEAGVASWLVAFLATETVAVATFALSLFWAALAGGRLVAGRVADRFVPGTFAASCAILAAAALTAALVVPPGPARIALFGVTGFCLGPVYPTIMAAAGALVPHRAAAVSGLLTFAAVLGSVLYPPLMGIASEQVGLGAGMAGAAALAVVAAGAVLLAARAAGPRDIAAPVAVP